MSSPPIPPLSNTRIPGAVSVRPTSRSRVQNEVFDSTPSASIRARIVSTNPRILQRNSTAAAASILALPNSRPVRGGINSSVESSNG